MNKNLAKIIALALTVSAFSAIAPKSIDKANLLGAQEVQAASKGKHLKDVSIETNKGKNKYVYTKNNTTSSKYRIDKVDDDDITLTLYSTVPSNTSKVSLEDINVESGYYYEISKGSDDYDEGDDIKISSGTTKIKIKIYDNANKKLQETYTLNVKKESSNDDDDDSSDYDDIYLDRLKIKNDSDTIDFDFSKKKTSFDVTVNNNVDYVKITAEPEDDDVTVKIDGTEVDDGDDWQSKKISLKVGKNEIPIKLKNDDDEQRKYTLNITRKEKTTNTNTNNTTANTTTTTNTNNAAATTAVRNGWVRNGYAWNYYLNGTMQRNQLFYDRTYGKNYYVDANGIMATGWRQLNSTWYYFDNSGAMRTGWVLVNGKWYFMDTNGKMLANTSVSGYRLGSDGAWIR